MQEQSSQKAVSAGALTPASPAPILIVDDEPVIVMALEQILRQAHFDVVTTSNPMVALEELRKREFSVVVSDQRMPGLSGLELLAQARQLRPRTTRILITAVLSLDTVIEAINRGEIYRFIVKPWLRAKFLASIANGVQRYELLCQNEDLREATQNMNKQLVKLNRSLEQQVQLVAQQNQQLAGLNQALEANFFRSLELCVHTMETFYPSLGNQARRVAELCKAIATVLGLPPQDARVLESSARLHDIGLVGIPRQLIRRWQENPGELTSAEVSLIQQHPILGQDLAAFGSGLEAVGEVIRGHHERFEGTGYPDELRGENISWLARLLAVAVAYCSTLKPSAEALDEVKRGAGSAFDPDAVRALLRALPLASLPRKEREVTLAELRPGMVLARGIYTSRGLLLMPEGQHLSGIYIEKLANHDRVQPLAQSLVVYC